MIDPALQPPTPPSALSESAAARLAALRQPTGKKRSKPAHTSKVLTAGISTTALFGMVAIMGWQTGTSTAQTPPPVLVALTATPAPLPTPVPSTVVPLVPTPVPSVPATPTIAAPIPVLVPIPVAVPAAHPAVQTNNGRAQSNTTTKSSG